MSTNHNLSEEKEDQKRYRTEVLPLTGPRLTARPNRLPRKMSVRVHFALRPQKRDGLSGTGTGTGGGGGGDERVKARPRIRPKKTRETVDRRQNNRSVKAVSPRLYAATSALRNCCFSCRAAGQSQGQCLLHSC